MGTHEWKVWIKHRLPPDLLNATLLRLPFLYGTRLVAFENNLGRTGIQELLQVLSRASMLPGDVIECGSSRAGTSVIMSRWLRGHHITKRVYACDSFTGFRPDELARERSAGMTSAPLDAFTSTSYNYVLRKLEVLGLMDAVVPVKGYFQDTLRDLDGPFCFALIDCDLQESLEFAAEDLWLKLSPGGFLVFDDYRSRQFIGASRGVDAFVARHQDELVGEPMTRLYWTQQATRRSATSS